MPLVTIRGNYVRNLLNVIGQSFIISGFVFFLLAVPLYYVYPPFYTSAQEHATNLLFFTQLGFLWTLAGLYPIILSMAIKEIEVGDLVFYRADQLSSGPGVVLEKIKDAPTGFMDEEDEWYGFFGASKDEYDDDPSHELDFTDYEDEEDDDDEDDGEYDYLK